ncbi:MULTISPECIES: helix-turn-helix domain-containing protein [Thiomicrorhabdus]|uniref:Putative Fis-like DNA-binding protein n=1 Tax=Thiomicrorhabdus heinhorstiae TaxID=2748010 RepID=A0ABS0BWL5_9GAMM|nr:MULTISPECIES: helix-turn-helix domain-containing protein [Thiomicrorhabdus]MBF6058200.1 Fis family transcriptional regulator [Thiomicrorhabdus heinhorstiae]
MSDKTPQNNLSIQVTQTLEVYFETLEDQSTCDLHEMVIQQVERPLIEFVLNRTQHNQTQTAQILGINRNTLRKKMLKYQLIES